MRNINLYLKTSVISWFIFWIGVLFLRFYPIAIFRVNQLPLPIEVEKAETGKTVVYIEDYCKYVGAPGNVTHALQKKLTKKEINEHIQDILVTFDTMQKINVPMGCHTLKVPIPIPVDLEKGREYRIIKNIHVKVNIIRNVDLEFVSDWFTVI